MAFFQNVLLGRERQAKSQAESANHLLSAITQLQRAFIAAEDDLWQAFTRFLQDLLSWSGAQQGFLAEVAPSHQVVLRASWPVSENGWFQALGASVMQATQTPLLFEKHAGFHNGLMMPMIRNNQLMGVLGLLNLPQTPSQPLIEVLQPAALTSANILQAYRIQQQREQALTDLQIAKSDAEAANRNKDLFIAKVTHELRTPLNTILGFSEMLEAGYAGELNPQQQKYANNVLTSGNHLLALVNDLLDISKIESGHLDINPQPIALSGFIDGIQQMVQDFANAKNVQLTFNNELDTFVADEVRLNQIFINLVRNAIKFNRNNGRVTVYVDRVPGDWQRIRIIDTGIGIPLTERQNLFQAFHQASNGYNRHYEGTGLGLALTHRLVALHGGHIQVESQEGQGSCFTVHLPTNPLAGG